MRSLVAIVWILCMDVSLARAGDGLPVESRCLVEASGNFAVARITLWNTRAAPVDYRVGVRIESPDGVWRSTVLTGTLEPGQAVRRLFRPFGDGIPIVTCSVVQAGALWEQGHRSVGELELDDGPSTSSEARHAAKGALLGMGVAAAGAVVTGALGYVFACASGCEDDDALVGALLGGYLGYVVGFPLGFSGGAEHHGSKSWVGASLGGSLLASALTVGVIALTDSEAIGGFLLGVAPPLGAVAGFYAAHRHGEPVLPMGAQFGGPRRSVSLVITRGRF